MVLHYVFSYSVTKELRHIDLVEFVGLDMSKEQWCDILVQKLNCSEKRRNYRHELLESRFSSVRVGELLETYYRGLLAYSKRG